MHNKQLGNIAEFAVCKELSQQGFPVFKELGDLSKVDIITLINGKPVRIQVKKGGNVKSAQGCVFASIKKSGPNGYRVVYTPDDFDILAVYIDHIDKVCFIPWSKIGNAGINIRYEATLNGQNSGVKWYEDYLDVKKVLEIS